MKIIEILKDIRLYSEKPKDNGKYGLYFIGIWDDLDDSLDKKCKFVGIKNEESISLRPNTIFKIENNNESYYNQYKYLNIKLGKLYKLSNDQKIYEYFSEAAEAIGTNKLVYDPDNF